MNKHCRKCNSDKPETEFYIKKTCKLSTYCKDCLRRESREWNNNHKEYRKRYFYNYYAENKEKIKQKTAQYQKDHKERNHFLNKQFYLNHPGSNSARSKRYREKHPDRCRESQKKYRETHIEKRKAIVKKYRDNNKDKVYEWQRRKWARRHNAPGSHTREDVAKRYEQQNGKCFWCGKQVFEIYHVDHVIPLSRGGSDNPDNIVISCPLCNERKHNFMPDEWLKRRK